MTNKIGIKDVFSISEDVVAREIEGELIIIPLKAGVGNIEENLYTLNATGREIWKNLDGEKTIGGIAETLGERFNSDPGIIIKDIIGLISELLKRRMVTKKRKCRHIT